MIIAACRKKKNFRLSQIILLIFLGFLLGLGSIVHNLALLLGLVSYTVSIKRSGVLFGVFWGWLFFHEQNLKKKLAGAIIAISGVVTILFS